MEAFLTVRHGLAHHVERAGEVPNFVVGARLYARGEIAIGERRRGLGDPAHRSDDVASRRLAEGAQSLYPLLAPQLFGNAHIAYALGPSLPTAALAVHWLGHRAADRTAMDGATLPAAPAAASVPAR